jgi:hypothetical protein
LGKFEPQSTAMILIGRCPDSNGLQFYNPKNGTFVSSIDFKIQPNVTSVAHFGYKYQPGIFVYRLDESTSIFSPAFPLDTSVLVHTHSPPSPATIVGVPTFDSPDMYTVAFKDGSLCEYPTEILSLAPSTVSAEVSLLPKWVKDGTNATLFLHSTTKPRHVILGLSSNDTWYFYPGKNATKEGILLPYFLANCQGLLDSGQLFRGHAKFRNIYDTRTQFSLRDCVLCHVSAHWLQSLIAPASLKAHSKFAPSDKKIWDVAYFEEYNGLCSLPSWEVVTERQYLKISKGRRSLPTMAPFLRLNMLHTISRSERNTGLWSSAT